MVCGLEIQNEIDALLLNKQVLLDQRVERAQFYADLIAAVPSSDRTGRINDLKVARAKEFGIIDEQIRQIDLRLKAIDILIANDCEPLLSTMSVDLSNWDRNKPITVTIKGFISFCVVRFQVGGSAAEFLIHDNAGNLLLRKVMIEPRFTVTRETGRDPDTCRAFDFFSTIKFDHTQVPAQVISINLEVIVTGITSVSSCDQVTLSKYVSNRKIELEIFDVDVPLISEAKPMPEEPGEGLTLDQKIGIVVGTIAVAIGAIGGIVLSQKN